jgi:TPR repeat protein
LFHITAILIGEYSTNQKTTARFLAMEADFQDQPTSTDCQALLEGIDRYNDGDFQGAKLYFEEAMEEGNTSAMHRLAKMYYNGNGMERNPTKAKALYEKGCELGDSDCINSLGVMYYNGDGVPQDHKKSFEFHQLGASMGNIRCCYNLGMLYHKGRGVEMDFDKAIEFYSRATGNEKAYYNIAVMITKGKGFQIDGDRARHYYELAAKKGHFKAAFNLANMYNFGKFGQKVDAQKAIYYYDLSAINCDVHGVLSVASIYLLGKGAISPDREKAKVVLKRGVDLGDAFCTFKLAKLHFEENDFENAKFYFEMNVPKKEFGSILCLATIYFEGLGGCRDTTRTFELFGILNQMGKKDELYEYAIDIFNGDGMPQDYGRAKEVLEWMDRVNSFDSYVSYHLGLIYYNGWGAVRNLSKAKHHFERAVVEVEQAQHYLDLIKNE